VGASHKFVAGWRHQGGHNTFKFVNLAIDVTPAPFQGSTVLSIKVAEGWSANRPIGYELAHLALLTSS
jgi:hypothetical protein